MYPYGCKSSTTTALVSLTYTSGTVISSWTASDSNIFSPWVGSMTGTFKLEVTPYWNSIDVPDYTVRVIAASSLSITGGSKTSASH